MEKTEKIIQELIDSSIGRDIALKSGNSRDVGKHFNNYIKSQKTLREMGIEAINSALLCLKHENPYIRLNVAITIIPFYPDLAREVIQEVAEAKRRGLVEFSAEMFLKEWDAGRIKFDF